MKKVTVAIAGASGYSGEELVRILLGHPRVELTAITSRQYAGQTLAQVFPRFALFPAAGRIQFCQPDPALLAERAEYIFLALPHGVSAELAVPLSKTDRRVIDLSADFRLRSAEVYREFYAREHPAPELLAQAVYGLPEVYRQRIATAKLVAAPGCYPTSILLPILPLIRDGLIQPQAIVADSLSGVSGAGRKAELDYLFCECNESLRPYGVPKHRHLSEIEQELTLTAGKPVRIQFTPHLVPVNRGMLTTLYLAPTEAIPDDAAASAFAEKVGASYAQAYASEPFVRLLAGKALPDTKNVNGTNCLEMAWRQDPRTGRLVVMSAQDNLVKGASGQAVQCFNLMAGFEETEGLN